MDPLFVGICASSFLMLGLSNNKQTHPFQGKRLPSKSLGYRKFYRKTASLPWVFWVAISFRFVL